MKRLVFLLFPLLFLLPHAQAQSTQNSCIQGACYGFGAPQGACVGAFVYSDISQTPVQAYSCSNGGWVKSGGSGGGASGPVLISTNLVSRYALTDGSGTAPIDSSGNGHAGIFPGGAGNPTWSTTGLMFNGSSNFFTAPGTRAARTIVWVSSLPSALNNSIPVNPQFVSPFGVTDLSFLYGGNSFYGTHPGVSSAGSTQQFSNDSLQGTHVWALTLGTNQTTDPDQLYKDGVPSTYTGSLLGTTGFATADLEVGGVNSGFDTWFPGQISFIEFFTDEKTPTQIAVESASIQSIVAARGVSFSTPVDPTVKSLYIAVGDSLTNGEGVIPSSQFITPTDTFDVLNYGLGNAGSDITNQLFFNRELPKLRRNGGRNVIRLWIGTNDISTLTGTNASALAGIQAYCAKARQAGFQTIFSTAIDRTGESAALQSLNAFTIGQNGCDLTLDLAANALLGATGANTNTTNYQGDNVHLTQVGQQNLVAPAETRAINLLAKVKSPQPSATVTASTYTMVDADLYLPVSPASNSVAVTLPDCTYFTGLTHSIKNLQASGANTVTVAPASGQLVDGSATAITVANAATLVVKDVVINRSTAGCSWVRVQNN